MITVEFSKCFEIRMVSPYKTCSLHLAGEWMPDLEEGGWVAVQARSPDGRYLVLANVSASEKGSHSGRCWSGPVIHQNPLARTQYEL